MIELSIPLPSSREATQPVLRRFWRSPTFSRRWVVRSCLVFVLASASFGHAAPLAKEISKPAQTSNTVEGLKLLTEGYSLSQLGTRASLNEAIDKYNAASELFRKDNFQMGIGTAMFAAGSAYSSLGQKRRALDAFLDASTYLKEGDDSSLYATAIAGIGLAYTDLSDWKPAIEFLNQALTLLSTEKNPEAVASVLCGLGRLCLERCRRPVRADPHRQ